jgi:hypothetical protein
MKRKATILMLVMMMVLCISSIVFADEYTMDISAPVNQPVTTEESTIVKPYYMSETVIDQKITCYQRDLRTQEIELMWQETYYKDLNFTNGYDYWIETDKNIISRNDFYETYHVIKTYHYWTW